MKRDGERFAGEKLVFVCGACLGWVGVGFADGLIIMCVYARRGECNVLVDECLVGVETIGF